jgi:hypothetical protein
MVGNFGHRYPDVMLLSLAEFHPGCCQIVVNAQGVE